VTKYDGLSDRLRDAPVITLTLTFDEIADLVPAGLPASAYQRRPWWGNEQNLSHVQARAWLSAGWRVDDVSLTGRRVRFARTHQDGGHG
jgi:hypothetical protein